MTSPSQPGIANPHLTDRQLGELLSHPGCAAGNEAAELHLGSCETCAAELAGIRQALALFQQASTTHADREFTRLRTSDRPSYRILPGRRPYSQTVSWLAASAVLLLAMVPLEMRWQHPSPSLTSPANSASIRTAESDEALLEDVNQDLSRTVPSSMQALDDPTGSSSSQASNQSANPTSAQRKD